jgi:hypothetical protein
MAAGFTNPINDLRADPAIADRIGKGVHGDGFLVFLVVYNRLFKVMVTGGANAGQLGGEVDGAALPANSMGEGAKGSPILDDFAAPGAYLGANPHLGHPASYSPRSQNNISGRETCFKKAR